MIEELIQHDNGQMDHHQEEILRQYCAGIGDRLSGAGSCADALAIVEDACTEFDMTCESEVLRSTLRKLLLEMVRRKWGA